MVDYRKVYAEHECRNLHAEGERKQRIGGDLLRSTLGQQGEQAGTGTVIQRE